MSKSVLSPILSAINAHPRDKNLVFDEPTHKYTIITDPGSKYTSVTTWNHSHFPHFDADKVIRNMMRGKNWNPDNKYWGLTAQQIKNQWSQNGAAVSGAGTDLHFDIECFMNQDLVEGYTHNDILKNFQPNLNTSDEWNYFIEYAKTFPDFKPYRTEWMIYDEELKLAGSIDMVYENPDGTLSIYDWKRAKEISKVNGFKEHATTECVKHLPNTNYWHYSLQLNTYKTILERQYGKKVTDLYLVRLHPNNSEKTFELIKCADLSQEIADLFDLRKDQIQNPISKEAPTKKNDNKSFIDFFKKSYGNSK